MPVSNALAISAFCYLIIHMLWAFIVLDAAENYFTREPEAWAVGLAIVVGPLPFLPYWAWKRFFC